MHLKYLFLLYFFVSSWAGAQAPLPAQTAIQTGGVLKFAVVGEPTNYDCHAQSSFSFIHAVRPHYSTLLAIDTAKYPSVKGDLAASWTVSDDRLTYTFKLKPGVRFHDGAALTAEDVRASYERIRRPPPGVISVRAERYADIAFIDTPDTQTVVFKLARPNNAMLSHFASPFDCIYRAAKLDDDAKFPERNVLGTGPFVFDAHVPGVQWRGRRFAAYHDKGKPYLDGYSALFMPRDRMAGAFAAGDIHAEFRGLAPVDREQVVRALGARVAVQESPWSCAMVVTFNTAKKPFNTGRVRRALSLAIDRWSGAEALSKVSMVRHVGGLMRPGSAMALPEQELAVQPGFAKDIAAARAQARKLLQEVGVGDLSFTLTNRQSESLYGPVGDFLVDQWRQIGVTVRHERNAPRAFLEALQRENPPFDAALDFACDYADDPNLQLARYLSHDRTATNYGQHFDRTLDSLFDRQSGETDRRKRSELVREFEHRALRLAYVVPVLWWQRTVVMDRNVRGWRITPSHYAGQDLADVWLAR
ncbi:MAG: ABC transporter substrate-binding protein [Burkholderiales bacterium]